MDMNMNEVGGKTGAGVPGERPTSFMRERRQPMMRTRSVGRTCDLAVVRPVVSCDSIHFWAQSNPMAARTPNVESKWSLNHRKRTEGAPLEVSYQRNKSFNDAYESLRRQVSAVTAKSEEIEEPPQQPPNIIVFINSAVKRQRRRSSLCSQITMDEAIRFTDADDDDGDHSNTSLDVQDVFSEIKKYKKTNDDSSTSSSSSNYSSSNSTIDLSSSKNSLLQQKKTVLRIKTVIRKRSVSNVRVIAKVPRGSSTNSAKQRWIPEEIDDQIINDGSQRSESEYEDYAQDSLGLGNHSRNNLIRRVDSLRVTGNEVVDDDNNSKITIPRSYCSSATGHTSLLMEDQKKITQSSPNAKSLCGRAA